MQVSYNFKTTDKLITLSLKTTDLGDYNIYVTKTFNIDDISKVGNFIDKQTFGFRFCYILIKEFQDAINKYLMVAATIIEDEELKDKIVSYGKSIMTSDIMIIPDDICEKMINDMQNFIESKS